MVYQISREGIELIRQHEGWRARAYQDVAGVWTIGYGHTRTAKPGMVVDLAQGEALLREDVADAERAVNQLVTVPLEQREYDALVSWTFNLGRGALARSTSLQLLNAGDKIGAALRLTDWHKAMVGGKLQPVLGLARRRLAEAQHFLG